MVAKKVSTSEKKVRQIRRKSHKQYSGEEKIRNSRIRCVCDAVEIETPVWKLRNRGV